MIGAGYYVAPVGAFSPSDIPGLVGWFDFSDITTLFQDTGRTTPITADAQALKGVTDKSGAGHHVSDGVGATYKANIVNGRSVVRFTTNGTILRATPFTLPQPVTVFVVADVVTPATVAYIYDGSAGNTSVIQNASATSILVYAGASLSKTITNNAMLTPHVLVGQFNGVSSQNVFDGSVTSGDAGATAAGGISLGNAGAGVSFIGDMCEVYVYNTAVSAGNITTATNALKAKWGIA